MYQDNVFHNSFLLKFIISKRKEILSSPQWLESISRPLHTLIIDGEFDMLKHSLHKYSNQHRRLLTYLSTINTNNLSTSTIPYPIEAAACANRLDMVRYLYNYYKKHHLTLPIDLFVSGVSSDLSVNYAAKNANLEMVHYLIGVGFKWSNQTIVEAIDSHDGDETIGIEIIKYLYDRSLLDKDNCNIDWDGDKWSFKDDRTSPIYRAIEKKKKVILRYLLTICRLSETVNTHPNQYTLGTPAVRNRCYHLAIRSGDIEMIELITDNSGDQGSGKAVPIDQKNHYLESILSSLYSNNIDTINYIYDKFNPPPITPIYIFLVERPFMPDVALTDKVLQFINSSKCVFRHLIYFTLDSYVENRQMDYIKYLRNTMANNVFNPTRLVERGDIKTLDYIIKELNVYVSQKVSIISAIEMGDLNMMKYVLSSDLVMDDPSKEDKLIKQYKLTCKLLWYNTKKRAGMEIKNDKGDMAVGQYLECLQYALESKIIELKHIIDSLLYWDGDLDLFKFIPALVPTLKKTHPRRILSLVEKKLCNRETPETTHVQLYSNNSVNDRPPFYHGVRVLIQLHLPYFMKECTSPLGDWICGNDDPSLLLMVQYIASLGNPNFFTKYAVEQCLKHHKSYDVLKYLSEYIYPSPITFTDRMLITTHLSLDTLRQLFPPIDESVPVDSFEHAYQSKQYKNILYALNECQRVGKIPNLLSTVDTPIELENSGQECWRLYPIHILLYSQQSDY